MSNRKLPPINGGGSSNMNVGEILYGTANWLARISGRHEVAKRIGGPVFPIIRAAGENSNSIGGVIVPFETAKAVAAFRDRAVFRANASVYPMMSDTLTVPRRSGSMTANFFAESSVMTESAPAWDAVTLNAKKVAIFDRFSSELEEDSAIELAAYFMEDAGNAIGLKEDDCGFNGDGTSAYGGMRGVCPLLLDGTHNAGKVAAASTHSTFATLDAADIAALMAALPDKYWPNAKFYISGFGAATLFMRLGAAGGGLGTSRSNMNYGGIPIVLTPKLPGSGSQTSQVMMLFGDLSSAAALGSRRELEMATSSGKYLELDQLAYRVTERFDIVVHNMGDNTTAGAITGLIGTA
jgi:HK97 family phage major capsid protein